MSLRNVAVLGQGRVGIAWSPRVARAGVSGHDRSNGTRRCRPIRHHAERGMPPRSHDGDSTGDGCAGVNAIPVGPPCERAGSSDSHNVVVISTGAPAGCGVEKSLPFGHRLPPGKRFLDFAALPLRSKSRPRLGAPSALTAALAAGPRKPIRDPVMGVILAGHHRRNTNADRIVTAPRAGRSGGCLTPSALAPLGVRDDIVPCVRESLIGTCDASAYLQGGPTGPALAAHSNGGSHGDAAARQPCGHSTRDCGPRAGTRPAPTGRLSRGDASTSSE
jgi:hypothetical protein